MKWRRAWELKRVKLPEEDEDKREPESDRMERPWRSWKDDIEGNALGNVGHLRAELADVDRGGIMVAFRCGKVMS